VGLDDSGACRQDWRRTPKPQSPHVICYNYYLQYFSFSGSPSFPVYGYYRPYRKRSSSGDWLSAPSVVDMVENWTLCRDPFHRMIPLSAR
jgi:hypothetical protein